MSAKYLPSIFAAIICLGLLTASTYFPNSTSQQKQTASETYSSQANNMICFDGNDRLDMGIDAGNGLRTIECWFKPTEDISPQNLSYIGLIVRNDTFSQHNANNHEFGLSFAPRLPGNARAAGRISFGIRDAAGNGYIIYSDNNFWKAGEWHHVAGVILPNFGMRLFVDGQMQREQNSYDQPTGMDKVNITAAGVWGNENTRYFHGCIDEIRLSATALYYSNFTPPCPDLKGKIHTKALYNFNGSGNSATDASFHNFQANMSFPQRRIGKICGRSCGIDTDVIVDPVFLESVENGAAYQWINCSENIAVPGENDRRFTPLSSGDYAVVIDNGSCKDTSACVSFTVTLTSLDQHLSKGFQAFPNPFEDQIFIRTDIPFPSLTIDVFDQLGRKLSEITFGRQHVYSLSIEGTAGVYLLKLRTNKGVIGVTRIMKR